MAQLTMEQWEKKVKRWSGRLALPITEAFMSISPILVRTTRNRFLSGQVLNIRTRGLWKSIRTIIKKSKTRPRLFLGTDVRSKKGFGYGAYWFRRGRDFLNPPIQSNMSRLKTMIKNNLIKEYKKIKAQ